MRRLAAAALALAAAGLPAVARADYGATIRATPGVAGYWPLDEASGPAIADVVAGRSANLAPTAAFGRPPGIDFGGTSVSLAGASGASFGNVDGFTGDLSLEAWVAPTTTSGDRYVISKGTLSSGYHLLVAGGGLPAFQVNGTRIHGAALPAGGWHQLVATLAGRAMSLYVDGRLAAAGTASAPPAATSQALWIGRYSRSGSGYFQGGLDELSAYASALDAGAVAAHFGAGADTSPPHTILGATPPAQSDTPDGTFTFSGSKGGLTFRCSLDGAAGVPCLGAYSYDLLQDGDHTLTVTATDRWGTVEAPAAAYTWTVALPANETAPPVTTVSAAPPPLSSSAAARFVLSGSKTKLTWACRLDGGAWAPCAGSATYAALGEGAHTFEARATDRWGVVEATPLSYAWTIDLTPPDTFALATRPTAAAAGFAVVGTERGAALQCQLGGAGWSPCAAAFALPRVSAPVQLLVRAVDGAGNADPTPATLELDPPNPAAPVAFSGADQAVLIGGNRSIGALKCSLDGAAPASCPWPLDFPGLGYGAHALTITDPQVPGVVVPTLTWTSPLPIPLLAGSQFPALLSLGTPGAQARIAKSRLPRLLFQSSAAGVARVRLVRGRRTVARWSARVIQGSNLVTLPRAAYRRLRPGRYGIILSVGNASGTSKRLRLRFDAVRAGR